MFDSSNGNFDIQKSHINDKGYFVVTAGETNNGILGKSDIEARIFEANTITIDMFGFVFFRQFEYKMVTHARVFSLKPKFKTTHKQGLFLASLFKHLKTKFGYDNMCSWAKIKDDKIQLPINKDGDIDFEFMESFVAELEAERVAELEAYLAAASLKDYELTAAELSALSKFENYNWGEFRIADYFKKVNLKNAKFDKRSDTNSEKTEKYNLPLVNAKHGDNGIMFYGSSDIFDFTEMSICIVQNGAVATGDVYPQPQKTGVLWDAYLIKWANIESNNEILFYATTAIHKTIKQKFSYDFKATWERVKKEKIYLPTNNGDIDFEFMNNFIKAIKKLVIKDVVLYTDNKIKATKSIVSSNQ
ncbi:restriction endonuclease subunit S [Campylobacter sp. P091]|uniref:restriction endonuclease subunit S n=1 Tax=Campylobacter sp. P091 TaxID=1895621 RepID=UPI001F4188A4|nr:restriction endonuclease subunit S [Campylobacter sp. P091]